MALLVQDENDDWHYYSFASARGPVWTFMCSAAGIGTPSYTAHKNLGSSDGYSLSNGTDIKRFLVAKTEQRSKLREFVGKIDYSVYFEGDFSQTFKACDELYSTSNHRNRYRLLDRNCMHYALSNLFYSSSLSITQRVRLSYIMLRYSRPKKAIKQLVQLGGASKW